MPGCPSQEEVIKTYKIEFKANELSKEKSILFCNQSCGLPKPAGMVAVAASCSLFAVYGSEQPCPLCVPMHPFYILPVLWAWEAPVDPHPLISSWFGNSE